LVRKGVKAKRALRGSAQGSLDNRSLRTSYGVESGGFEPIAFDMRNAGVSSNDTTKHRLLARRARIDDRARPDFRLARLPSHI
jgi:hypothetical protein